MRRPLRLLALLVAQDVGEPGWLRATRSRLAEASFRRPVPGIARQDAAMNCLSAMQIFEGMDDAEVEWLDEGAAVLDREPWVRARGGRNAGGNRRLPPAPCYSE